MDILKNNKRTVLLLSAVILANTGLQILVPRFLSAFIDRAETNAPMTAIALIIAGYLFTVAAQKGGRPLRRIYLLQARRKNYQSDKAPDAGTFH